MDNAGTKSDGRNVSFPGGAQAENESQGAGRQTGLVGMRHDGRIEQRRGFQRVFGQEIGADQESSLFGYFLNAPPKTRAICSKRSRKSVRICWWRCENSAETPSSRGPTRSSGSAMILAMIPAMRSGPTRTEGPQENAGLVGIEDGGGTFEVNGHKCCRLIPEDDRSLKARQYVLRQLHLRQ